MVLDLTKQSEKREREMIVSHEFRRAIEPPAAPCQRASATAPIDFSQVSKHRQMNILKALEDVARWTLYETRFFCSRPRWCRRGDRVAVPERDLSLAPEGWRSSASRFGVHQPYKLTQFDKILCHDFFVPIPWPTTPPSGRPRRAGGASRRGGGTVARDQRGRRRAPDATRPCETQPADADMTLLVDDGDGGGDDDDELGAPPPPAPAATASATTTSPAARRAARRARELAARAELAAAAARRSEATFVGALALRAVEARGERCAVQRGGATAACADAAALGDDADARAARAGRRVAGPVRERAQGAT
ncbi:phosphatidylinositol-4-phosphate phosphatase [Aureococcus anophagefferens]|nr:phosphatidylinositol-4-phosphate phosphatase [Aureococcus anophagefferens]